MRLALLAFALVVLTAVAPAGAGKHAHEPALGEAVQGPIAVTGAWVRATMAGRPSAGYLIIANSASYDDRLIAVTSPNFETIEMHRTEMTDGVMKMSPIEFLEIPAGDNAEMAPGGAHLMLFGSDALAEGDSVTMTLVFDQAGEIDIAMPVQKAGMGGHKH